MEIKLGKWALNMKVFSPLGNRFLFLSSYTSLRKMSFAILVSFRELAIEIPDVVGNPRKKSGKEKRKKIGS